MFKHFLCGVLVLFVCNSCQTDQKQSVHYSSVHISKNMDSFLDLERSNAAMSVAVFDISGSKGLIL